MIAERLACNFRKEGSSFLKIGIILVIFQIFGTIPKLRETLYKWVSGLTKISYAAFMIDGFIPSSPRDFLA